MNKSPFRKSKNKKKKSGRRVGRPCEYKEAYTQKAKVYLETYQKLGDAVPTIEGFADFIEVSKKTIYNWMKPDENKKTVASEEFLHAVSRIETRQGRELQNGGLTKRFSDKITALLLSSNHGMREKSDVTSDDKPLPEGLTIHVRKTD